MRIGINARILQNAKTGIPYYVKHLYSKLKKYDKENQFIFFQSKKKSLFQSFLFDNFLVNKLIQKKGINIFHGPAHILPFWKKSGVKYLLTIHDLSFLVYPHHHSWLFNLYYNFFVGRSLNNADLIVADSNNTKSDIIKFYKIPEDRIKVIYLGVSDLFFNSTKMKRLIKEKYFLTLTTHPQRKNTLSILESIKDNENLLKYQFVIAGLIEKEQEAILKHRIKILKLKNNVILWGYATEKELVSLYQHAEFFIYPSFYEGFGLPVLEAMACKCPVITSNNSSLVEITPDKTWLVDPHKSKEIAKKMLDLINLGNKNRAELIHKNYIFSHRFTWDNTASQYLNIFNIIK